jgi:hypothetical protein
MHMPLVNVGWGTSKGVNIRVVKNPSELLAFDPLYVDSIAHERYVLAQN